MAKKIVKKSEDDSDTYDYCPSCGLSWDEHMKRKASKFEKEESGLDFICECDELVLVECGKPRFHVGDLDFYSNVFLCSICVWQDKKIRVLEKKLGGVKNGGKKN